MKKKSLFTITLIAIVCICSFTACKKEGVYKPKQKISRIYYEDLDGTKELWEKWTWDGKNLSEIILADGFTWKFQYDKKDRVEKITTSNGGYYIFSYNGKLMEEISHYNSDNFLNTKYEFDHTKNKITAVTIFTYIDISVNSIKQKKQEDNINALRYFIPLPVMQNLPPNRMKSTKSRESELLYTEKYEYIWDKNNIKNISYSIVSPWITFDYTYMECDYKYDKNYNPFYYSFLSSMGVTYTEMENWNGNNIIHSKNNVVSEDGFCDDRTNFSASYAITYEKNLPSKIYCESFYDGVTHIGTFFYTYE